MRENNRKPIEKCRKKLPQFTTMNVIDGQAGLVIYSSLIFYSLTIDNILNIVVLLILAGVAISMLSGDDGIIINAQKASEENDKGREQEIVTLAVGSALSSDEGYTIARDNLNSALANHIGTEGVDYTLSDTEPYIVTYLDSGRSYIIDEKGKVSEYVDITEYGVEVGQYVAYNPTISDLSGTAVEAEKLTYTSPTGSGTEHGNGYTSTEEDGGQTFTATADTKWRVLDIGSGTVTLISKNPITTDTGGNFTMNGAIGYLYAERELNEICKIYGYGYGADTSQVTKYNYGGPTDGNLTGEITGTGARSITIEDINKQAGITETDYTTLDSNYGSKTNPTTNVYYPTITTPNGKSSSAGVKNLEYTYYYYSNTKIENTDVQNMLFNGIYWLASRCIDTNSSNSYFNVRLVDDSDSYADYLCYGNRSDLNEGANSHCAVRPIVILKSNVIDTNTNYETEEHWNLK